MTFATGAAVILNVAQAAYLYTPHTTETFVNPVTICGIWEAVE